MPRTYANGHISATSDPIHFMFGSRVGFSGTADRTALFTVRKNRFEQIQDNGRRHLGFDVTRNSAIRSTDPENPTL